MLYESSFNDDLSYEEVTKMFEVTAELNEDLCELLTPVLGNVAGYVLGVCGDVNKEVYGIIVMLMRVTLVIAAI